MMKPNLKKESTLGNSQVESNELAEIMRVLAAQLQVSVKDTERPYHELTAIFSSMASSVNEGESAESGQLEVNWEVQYGKAIVAFQFYDRMCQRLMEVQSGLVDIAEHISRESHSCCTLNEFLADHRSLYESSHKREILSAISQPQKNEEALSKKPSADSASKPKFELF